MKTSNSPHAATSVLSLIAITAGTVSAALLIMFVGLFLTLMSVVSTSEAEVQTTASLASEAFKQEAVRVATVGTSFREAKKPQKVKKGHFMDALLRDEGNRHPTTSSSERQAPPTVHQARIYAVSAARLPSADTHLVQI